MNFFNTHISPEAIALAKSVLESGWISAGDVTRQFEEEMQRLLQLRVRPIAVNSGTAALHLALATIGAGPGDEVILPAQTFVATGTAILMTGATPVFADINPMTGNICPKSVEEKLTDNTIAIMPVHWGGYPCEMHELAEIACDALAYLIEDAAHALGAEYDGIEIGAFSDFTCFSFQAIKHLTTGDGGLLATGWQAENDVARDLSWFGINRRLSTPSLLGERQYELVKCGYKYHMNNIAAAIGLGNLIEFKHRFVRRGQNGEYYRELLQDVPGVQLLECSDDRTHAYWIFTLRVQDRLGFIRKLKEHGVPASVVHQRIDKHPIFGGPYNLPGQAIFDEEQVSLPVHDELSLSDISRICEVIKSGW